MELTPKTRKETFLAAAGGQDVTTPTPITREEVFLDEIAKGGGGSSLPSTETASAGDVLSLDDNKDPQWAPPSGSGGGVLVVDADSSYVLDKTYKEITDAVISVMRINNGDGNYAFQWLTNFGYDEHDGYYVTYGNDVFVTDSENGYPSGGGGGGGAV